MLLGLKKVLRKILSIETGVDTSDADAAAENIEQGKTAYANGIKLTGTLGNAGTSADVMVSADNIVVGPERGYDCVSTKYTNSEKRVHNAGWYVNQHMKFEDLATKLGITSDKIAKGNTILGIEGTAESGEENVIVFDTLEEMEQDTITNNHDENSIGVVYSQGWEKVKGTNKIVNTVKFPDTVVLDTPVTSTITGTYLCHNDPSNQWNFNITLTPTQYISERSNATMVTYTSTDGITYTRTQINNTTNDDIYVFDLQDGWFTSWEDEVLGNFIYEEIVKISDVGIWTNVDMIQFLNLPEVSGEEIVFTSYVKYPDLDALGKYILDNSLVTSTTRNYRYVYVVDKGSNVFEVHIGNAGNTLTVTTDNIFYIRGAGSNQKYIIDMNTKTHTTASSSATIEITEGTHWNILGLFPELTDKGHYFMQEAPVVTINGTSVSSVAITIPTLGWDITNIPEEAFTLKNQDKTITENGIYTADKGYTGLGEVTVNVQADGIKQFNSEKAMNADTTAEEGDLALVYGEQIIPMASPITIPVNTTIYFPETVVLPSVVTNEYVMMGSIYPKDMTFTLNPTTYKMVVTNTSSSSSSDTTIVTYTSTDGINYTRVNAITNYKITSSYEESFRWSNVSGWEYISNFICMPIDYFGGVFEYRTDEDENYLQMYGNMVVTGSGKYTADLFSLELASLQEITDKIYADLKGPRSYAVVKNDNGLFLYNYADSGVPGIIVYGGDYYRVSQSYTTSPKTSVDKYTIDLENMTYTKTTLSAKSSKYEYQTVYETVPTSSYIGIFNSGTTSTDMDIFGHNSSTSSSTYPMLNTNRVDMNMAYAQITRYYPINTQLSDVTKSDIYLNKTVFGGNGLVTGDGSIWDKMSKNDMMIKLYGNDNITTCGQGVFADNYNKYVASTNYVLSRYTNSMCVPIKLSEYTSDGENHIGLYERASHYVFTKDYTKFIEQDITNNKTYIRDIKTNSILFEYDTLQGNKEDRNGLNRIICVDNNTYLSWGYNDTTMYIYKFSTIENSIQEVILTPGGQRSDYQPFDVIGYNALKNKLYVYSSFMTTANSVHTVKVGYVDINNMEYVSLLSKDINYYHLVYTVTGTITSNQDVMVCWYIYGSNNTYKPQYWVYLINENDTVISKIEGSTTDPKISANNSVGYFTQYTRYDDGTYIYSSASKINKNTLAVTTGEFDVPNYAPFDFSYMYKDDTVYFGNNIEEPLTLPGYEGSWLRSPYGDIYIGSTIVYENDEYQYKTFYNKAKYINSYNWSLGSMADYDILLLRPTVLDNTGSERPTYTYMINQDMSAKLTIDEYNAALDTANEILGEEVIE